MPTEAKPEGASRPRRWAVVLGALAVGVAAIVADPVVAAPRENVRPPNIVYVVVDDLSSNLVPYMAEVEKLADESVSFENFFVTDSLCCPSRASTLAGQYPHNTKVRTNGWPEGGWGRFVAEGHLDHTIGTAMSGAGYRTGYIGKLLNGYEPTGGAARRSGKPSLEAGFVPPGWDEWHVAGDGYKQFDYSLATAVDEPVADVVEYGHEEDDYLTDVIAGKTADFLQRAAVNDQPFFLTVAPFAVHSRVGRDRITPDRLKFPPAPRDRAEPSRDSRWPVGWTPPEDPNGDCGDIAGGCAAVPFPGDVDAEGFGALPDNPPKWMPRNPVKAKAMPRLREQYLDRIRMAQSVDDLVGGLRGALDRLGLAEDTYVVFTSDNGYHLGEHGLGRGKGTAYDHDVQVPFFVLPPGGMTPRTVDAFAQNTDLLATFVDLAGRPELARGSDGRSLAPLIRGEIAGSGWRDGALIEHTRDESKENPDSEAAQEPPTYRAMRTADYLYVDYGGRRDDPTSRTAEFYDLRRDPGATVNRFDELTAHDRRRLDRALDAYATCTAGSCWRAGATLPEVGTTGA